MHATLASRNPHKAEELERLLPGWTIEPLDRDDYPPEDGTTYYENALGKARFGAQASRLKQGDPCRASGVSVSSL